MNTSVDNYFINGCMRCKFGGTPQCKVNNWQEELILLREIVKACDLKEEAKWGVPCYTDNGKNIVIISAFKNYVSLSFFKGALLEDAHSILVQQGENSKSARLIKFTEPNQIKDQKHLIESYIKEAINLERSGAKVEFNKSVAELPYELIEKFNDMPELETAFYALTPGRQRGYILHFSQPKQSKTKVNRIEKCVPKILNGEGLHDNY